ncbi:MAG: group-specific protein [Bacilli bacterium]
MKLYLASGLENRSHVQEWRDALTAVGHVITYDWTAHGRVQGPALTDIAWKEIHVGVQEADAVIVLLPGGMGTHTELGAALAWGKVVIVCAPDEGYFDQHSDRATMAYNHPWISAKLVAPTPHEVLHLLTGVERRIRLRMAALP